MVAATRPEGAGRLDTFEWNDNGNLEAEDRNGDITDYQWDDQDRLVHVETLDDVLDFVYDADGIKQAATIDSVVTRYVVDATFPYAQVLEERTDAGALIARYARGAQLLRQYRVNDESHAWYLHDALGSTRALAAIGGGSLTDEWDFEAFGEEARREGEGQNAWLFTGEERRAETGLDYLRARWREPASGRFHSLDLWDGEPADPSTENKYSYATANPIDMVDPSGLFAGYAIDAMVVSIVMQAVPGTGSAGGSVQAARKRIGFAAMWNNYPGNMSADDVYNLVGGRVLKNHDDNPAGFQNSCALRLSRAMNYGGYPIPHRKDQTGSGSDKKWYFYRVSDLARYVRNQFGPPDRTHTTAPEIASERGIILFTTCGWSDATGHIDLWDGTTCGDQCYWTPCTDVSLWRFDQ